MNKINSSKLRKNGYIFINKNNRINNFINFTKKIILKYQKDTKLNFNSLEIEKFEELVINSE